MKYFIFLLVVILVIVSGCKTKEMPDNQLPVENSEETKAQPELNQQITESAANLSEVLMNESEWLSTQCSIAATEGGPVEYSLVVTFRRASQGSFNWITFSVQDPQNSYENLLTKGPHQATGNHWDDIRNDLQSESYSLNGLKSDEMEIVWDVIRRTSTTFSGEGHINIKKTIKKVCPEKMWVGGHDAYKGDSDYLCSIEEEYPPQRIPFSCEGVAH